jgi:hypothetical protein
MFGRGHTRLQPVDVEDVAEAIARGLQPTARNPVTYELGGPRAYTFEELLKVVAERLGKAPILLSLPFPIWRSLARVAEMLPEPPLTRNQVELMEVDTVASAGMPGFDALGIAPQLPSPPSPTAQPFATAGAHAVLAPTSGSAEESNHSPTALDGCQREPDHIRHKSGVPRGCSPASPPRERLRARLRSSCR